MTGSGARNVPPQGRNRSLVSRRDLLKALPAAGLVAAGAALAGPGAPRSSSRTSTCRICRGLCGVRATIEDDRVVRVEGDPGSDSRGFICLHGMALRDIIHSPARLRRPLKKEGDSFREIPWEQALQEIASRLLDIRERFGPQALAVHSGWALVGHPIHDFLMRFCRSFGTPNLSTVASLCETAARMAQSLTTGSKCRPHIAQSRTAVVWGANPGASSPAWERVVASAATDGRNLIVIDPVRTDLAERATLHLSIRPRTDGALALGLMHVIVNEGLHDRTYVERYTVGFEALLDRIERFDPATVAGITSLPRESIEKAARMIAREGPTSIWTGLGLEHHDDATQTVRAVTILMALCGDLAVRGGAALPIAPGRRRDGEPLPCLYGGMTPHPVPPPIAARPIGYDDFPLFEAFNREAQANLYARAILEDRPYPLRALLLFGANPLVTAPGAAKLSRAAERLSLLVSIDPFLTASGRVADYVLPAATFAEGTPPPPAVTPAAAHPLVPEQHDSRTDWAILTGLAKALGLGHYFPWETLEEALQAPRVPWMADPEHALLSDRLAPGEKASFPTASGKIEIFSRTLERFGYDPLPDWQEPTRRAGPDRADYPLILVSGPRGRAYVNSQFRQIPAIAASMPGPVAGMHPETARRAGAADGERIAVVSPHGRIELRAWVTARVHPECVVVQAGWSDANANLLTDDAELDPISGFPVFRSGVCRVEPARA
jgi:anaerobic selenocysteine-containing dehydrogenase